MATKIQRQITEDEFYLAEEAFVEQRETGSTEKGCPWCGSALVFHDAQSGHTIACTSCAFKVTVRGL
jgi:hypothetical protein